MKKVLGLFLTLILMFSLASCKNSGKVTIIDENGNEVEVEIKQSKEKEDVVNAMTYASQADYEEIKSLEIAASVAASLSFTAEANDGSTTETVANSATVSGSAKVAANMTDFYANGSLSVKALTDGETVADSQIAGNAYYTSNDTLAYVDYTVTDNNQSHSEKVAVLVNDVVGSLPVQMAANPNPMPTEVSPELLYEAFYQFMVNSSIEISEVEDGRYTLTFHLSAYDIAKVANLTDSSMTLERDFTIDVNMIFDLKTGFIAEINTKTTNANAIYLLVDETVALGDVELSAEAKLSFKFNENVEVKTLTDDEKAEYKLAEEPMLN